MNSFSRICLYNNKIVVPLIETTKLNLVFFSYVDFKKETKKQTFKNTSSIKVDVKNNLFIKDVFMKVVDHYSFGLKTVVILVLTNKEYSIFMYCDSFNNKFLPVPSQSLSITKFSLSDIFLTHGPICFAYSDNTLLINLLFSFQNHNISLKHIFASYCVKVMQILSLGPFNPENFILCYLLVFHCSSSAGQQIISIALAVNTKVSSVKFEVLPKDVFFPKTMENVVQAINISLLFLPLTTKIDLKQLKWKDSSCIICSNTECFVFYRSYLTYCCSTSLSLVNVLNIEVNFCSLFEMDMNIVLIDSNKTVLYISKRRDCNKFSKSWSSIEAFLIGDVLLKGTVQLLMLKSTEFLTWQDDCLLIDLLSVVPMDVASQGALPDECLGTTMFGLSKKVQAGKLAITAKEQEISSKASATVDSLIRLNNPSLLHEDCISFSRSFQESLVDIIFSKDENKMPESSFRMTDLNLNIDHSWMKLVNNRWILGWRFCNKGERPICYPTMKATVAGQQVQCVQKVFHNNNHFSFDKKCHKQINSLEMFSLILSFEIPAVLEETIEIHFILSWYVGSSDEFDNEIFVEEKKKVLLQQQLVFKKTLFIEDILNQSISREIFSCEDLMLAQVSQKRIVLNVFSLHSTISDMEDFLCKISPNAVYILKDSTSKCLIFKQMQSPLFEVNMILKYHSPKLVEIQAFINNDLKASLLTQQLYNNFPADVVIISSLYTKEETCKYRRQVLRSMKDEADILTSLFHVHNIKDELWISSEKLQTSNLAGTILIKKETFKRMRKILVKKECKTDTLIKKLLSVY